MLLIKINLINSLTINHKILKYKSLKIITNIKFIITDRLQLEF